MTPAAVRTARNLNRCAIATRKSTVASRTVLANVPVGGLARLGALVERCRGLIVQLLPLDVAGVHVLGHEGRTRRCAGVVERVGLQPRVERDLVFGAESAHVEGGELLVARLLCLDPRVERRDVEELLLTTERDRLVRLDPHTRGRPVQERLAPVPSRGLVATPRGRDRNRGQHDDRQDLGDLAPVTLLACLRVTPRAARLSLWAASMFIPSGTQSPLGSGHATRLAERMEHL